MTVGISIGQRRPYFKTHYPSQPPGLCEAESAEINGKSGLQRPTLCIARSQHNLRCRRRPERWRDDALFRPEVRAAYAELVAMGWTDAVRLLHLEERIYTFWKYFRNAFARDAGLRIDHSLLSPSPRERLQSCGVDKFARAWEHTSDHAPVWIELHDDSSPQMKKCDLPAMP